MNCAHFSAVAFSAFCRRYSTLSFTSLLFTPPPRTHSITIPTSWEESRTRSITPFSTALIVVATRSSSVFTMDSVMNSAQRNSGSSVYASFHAIAATKPVQSSIGPLWSSSSWLFSAFQRRHTHSHTSSLH